jgi:hypothetical protein
LKVGRREIRPNKSLKVAPFMALGCPLAQRYAAIC